jgi:hypothetical protein
MSAGFFAIDRGVWEHPMFAREKFSEREAWIWLISSAAWEPVRVRVGRAWLELARGQCAFALRFLAEKWKWSEPRVRRFLKRLTDDAAALVSATRDATLITICNYDDYQSSRRTDVTTGDAAVESKSTNPRRKEERNKQTTINKEEKKEEPRASALIDDGWPNDFREQFWARYPHKVGKPKALAKLEQCRKRGVSWLALIAGLERYIREKPPDRSWMNPETFLNGERWNDQPAKVENGNRTGNPKTSGHDAILAVAARKARELDRNDDLAGTASEAGFAFGDGINRSGSCGNSDQTGPGERDHHRVEPDSQRVREGEIIPPDKNAAGIPSGRQFV